MISIHFIVDDADPAHLERGLLYLKRTGQRTVDIGAGSELARGMQFVARVKTELPNITVFWRNLDPEDTGIHSKMKADELYNLKVRPHLAWFKKYRPVFMPDNESSGDDAKIKAYVEWQVQVARLLHADGLNGAFCRFATGNIQERQYPLLKPIFDEMKAGDYISPNEYSNAPGKSSGGHLARYKDMWTVAGRELPTVIGEAGICPDYDPGKGFRAVPNMGGGKAAQQMIAEEVWYGNGKIDRHAYLIGGHGWESFQLIDTVEKGVAKSEFLDTLEAHYAKQPPIVVTPPPPVADYLPPRTYQPAVAHLKNGAGMVNLRSEKSIAPGTDIGDIRAGDKVKYAPQEGDWWPIIHVLPNGKETAGFAHNDYFEPVPRQSESPIPDKPDPLPIPPIEPPQVLVTPHVHIVVTLPAGIDPQLEAAMKNNVTIEFRKTA